MNSGSRLRNVHLATALAKRCQVTLLRVLQPGDRDLDPAEGPVFEESLTARKKKSYTPGMIAKGILGPLPVTVVNYASKDVAERLKITLEQRPFDAVQMETSNLFSYLDIIRSAPGSPAVLLDWHNIDSELMARYASETKSLPKKLIASRTATLLQSLERTLLNVCDAHTVVSERDKAELLKHNPQANVRVVPNGVDVTAFAYYETTPPGSNLLFVGSMDYHANVDAVLWFTREVWPVIAERFPALKFKIVGRSPAREVQMLASDKIEVTGTVDDVRPFYAGACVVVAPLRVGSGTRLKILEAMSMGVPVIATSLGAEGIDVVDEENILLADSAESMVNAIARAVQDADLRGRLISAARRLVRERYDWAIIGESLYRTHLELAQSRAGR